MTIKSMGNSIGTILKHAFSWPILKETYQEWGRDKASRLAASLTYYTATALAPLIVGLLAIVGFVYSREQTQTQIVSQVRTYVGAQGAEVVETILANADQPDLARLAGLLSLLVLLWSASNIFAQLQDALDTIWGVELRSDLPLLAKIQHRLLPLLTVLGIGLLLLAAVIATSALSAAGTLISELIPGGVILWQIVNFIISLVIITLLFGVIFKVLPDVDVTWRDVLPGAALTALLFMVGQFALGWYLGRQSGASLYGAAGSLIVLLLWLYYSAQIFLFGAEYTQVYATRYGQGVRPAKNAVARGTNETVKPAAQEASGGSAQPYPNRAHRGHAALVQHTSPAYLDNLPITKLVAELVDDVRRLYRRELELVQAELRETFTQIARGASLVAGGGLVAYGGAFFLLLAVPLLLWTISEIPLWLALLLVGLLTLFYGWLLSVWARRRLTQISLAPKQTIEMVSEDVEMVKEHLAH